MNKKEHKIKLKEKMRPLRLLLLKIIVSDLTKFYLRKLRRDHGLTLEQLSQLTLESSKNSEIQDSPLTPQLIKKYENGLAVPGKHLYQIFSCIHEEERLTEYSFECSRIFHHIKTSSLFMLFLFCLKQRFYFFGLTVFPTNL